MTSDPLQWEGKAAESQKAFEDASKTLKTEVTRFEVSCSLFNPLTPTPYTHTRDA